MAGRGEAGKGEGSCWGGGEGEFRVGAYPLYQFDKSVPVASEACLSVLGGITRREFAAQQPPGV